MYPRRAACVRSFGCSGSFWAVRSGTERHAVYTVQVVPPPFLAIQNGTGQHRMWVAPVGGLALLMDQVGTEIYCKSAHRADMVAPLDG